MLGFIADRDGFKHPSFLLSRRNVRLRGPGQAAREMPKSPIHQEVIGRRRLCDSQDLIPASEADKGQPGQMAQAWRFECFARAARGVRGIGRDLFRRAQGLLAAALEKLRPPEEMQVVRIIYPGIKTLGAALANVIAVGFHGALVGENCVRILPHAHVNVPRHVDEMPGRGRIGAQAVGRRQTVLRIRPRLDRMNVEMVRARDDPGCAP